MGGKRRSESGKGDEAGGRVGGSKQGLALGERETNLCLEISRWDTQSERLHDNHGRFLKEVQLCG